MDTEKLAKKLAKLKMWSDRRAKRMREPLVGLIILVTILFLLVIAFAEPPVDYTDICDEAPAIDNLSPEERLATCGDPFLEIREESEDYYSEFLYHD